MGACHSNVKFNTTVYMWLDKDNLNEYIYTTQRERIFLGSLDRFERTALPRLEKTLAVDEAGFNQCMFMIVSQNRLADRLIPIKCSGYYKVYSRREKVKYPVVSKYEQHFPRTHKAHNCDQLWIVSSQVMRNYHHYNTLLAMTRDKKVIVVEIGEVCYK